MSTNTEIFNPTNGSVTLPPPYGQILSPGTGIITADSPATIITNLGGQENLTRSGLTLQQVPSGANLTPAGAGTWAVANGGTGGATAGAARTNLGAAQAGATPTGSTAATAPPAINPTPLVTGTGMTASGQTMTSTDSKTATLDQYKGCLLYCAGHGPYPITGNTAVTGAPLVLTIGTIAPTTDAGVYGIYGGPSHIHAAGTLTQV